MIYNEEIRDIFATPKDYFLAHCISADFALGAGIAKEFKNRGVRKQLKYHYTFGKIGDALVTYATDWIGEFNLVTKDRYYEKPTLKSLTKALISMKNIILTYPAEQHKIAMPQIGCGLDRLKWEDVSEIIKDIFKDTNVEILICKLR